LLKGRKTAVGVVSRKKNPLGAGPGTINKRVVDAGAGFNTNVLMFGSRVMALVMTERIRRTATKRSVNVARTRSN